MIKISALPAAGALTGAELVPVVKSGVTSQTTTQEVANLTSISAITHAATSKVTPVDADELPLADSAALYGLKKLLWSNLKATLKTYFDGLYQPLATILTQLSALTTARGDLLYKGNAGWTNLAAGTSGQFLKTNGAGADPAWATVSPSLITTSYDSGDQTISSGGSLSLTHGLGAKPKLVMFIAKCLTAENNYSINDEIVLGGPGGLPYLGAGSSTVGGFAAVISSTAITVRFASPVANPIYALDKTSGALVGLTNANWAFVVRAYA